MNKRVASVIQAALFLFCGSLLCPPRAAANPQGATVTQGTATVSTHGQQTTVTTSAISVINWQSFNIGANETTTFIQPSSSSIVWNRVNDPNPSQIFGTLQANGFVVLQNQSGIFLGPHSFVSTAGLLLTTSPTMPADFSSAGMWQFNTPPPTAKIINYGQLNVAQGGSLFLIARDIENYGTMRAPGGSIGLYAGQQILLSERADGRGLSAQVNLPEGSVNNSGQLIADAGTIAMHAQVVNQGGLIQANSVREQNGVIELIASDNVTLAPSSVTEAKGDSQGVSPGGNITIKSGNNYNDDATSTVDVSGGAQGGNGGQVEISAPSMPAINANVVGNAAPGWVGGKLLIDPNSIQLVSSGGTDATSGTTTANDPPGTPDVLQLNVGSFASFSQILLQASQNIELSTSWNLNSAATASSLTLEAGNNINIDNGVGLTAGRNWSVTMVAGNDPANPGKAIAGQGSITVAGSIASGGFIQTSDSALTLTAGENVTVQALGAIRSMAGGSIDVTAVSGSVNTGSNPNGYSFVLPGLGTVSSGLGGISTAAGGDVTINAPNGSVMSFLPFVPSPAPRGFTVTDAGTGAFGPEPGNVTITAADVYGHYVVANGTGSINVSQNAGDPRVEALALSLVTGSWNVQALNGNIYLQEVRNPNGDFDKTGNSSTPTKHLFNYDPSDSVTLDAYSVDLAGGGPRNPGENPPIIYPPSLTIDAGAGGITLGSDVVLFPSPTGNLNITTTDGGSFHSDTANTLHTLAMSDSGSAQWTPNTDFVNGHAGVPVQLNNAEPVTITIEGYMRDINLQSPKETEVTVKGNTLVDIPEGGSDIMAAMANCGFEIQNLHQSDSSFVNVNGNVVNHNDYTIITVPVGDNINPNDPFAAIRDAVTVSGTTLLQDFPTGLPFNYDPSTHRIAFYQSMSYATEQQLLNLLVPVLLPDGTVQTVNGVPQTTGATFLDPATIQEIYKESQGSLVGTPLGYQISGPGRFTMNAGSLNLGSSPGMISHGADPNSNPALARLPDTVGAEIDLNLSSGDLTMFASRIASLGGGDVNVIDTGGGVNLGFPGLSADQSVALGIYTAGDSNVKVISEGTIDVQGSRIGSYNQGNVTVISKTGDVLAGDGGNGIPLVNVVSVDPVTHVATLTTEQIPGSGIFAHTLADGPAGDIVGNITISTPQGNIEANAGGISQIPENGNNAPGPKVTLTAGTKDPNNPNHVLYDGNIDVSGSGVIGEDINLDATGNITGFVVAQHNFVGNALGNFTGVAVAAGSASVNAGGSISGTIFGVTGVSATGGSVDAALLSQNVSVGGAKTEGGLASTTAASSTSQSAVQEQNAEKAAATQPDSDTDDEKRKRGSQRPLLTKAMGRVTVILPTMQAK
jgi:filamentous hemagglutinin family protein